jgi:hypothetical protein
MVTGLSDWLKETRRNGEMKNKRKFNQESKTELPKKYRKNKK